ncbi:alpha/beta-hydrolase [Bimuria novae-zelandiae CBS 107.79]|uniref:Alpha/beta-hydrolase n=1 Tax=Bimuria novae-zelandiae CBS 107.79 TaxID=1447943 RepID=A0A6A5V1E8_9PLEO|nr:alpha/beta-hydrolase [Bimuria novae-zelandiae CBS 107.79]
MLEAKFSGSSEEALPPFPDPEVSSITLEGKPGARIAYTYYPASASKPSHLNPFSKSLVVFLNGMVQPRASWNAAINIFHEKQITNRLPYPALLTYDRYGQGDSDRDPDDPPADGPAHGHDVMSVVHVLYQFTQQIWKEHLDPTDSPCFIFVGNSIGCAIGRLFAQTYPGTVLGLMFLDSVIANTDFVSLWPDPDAPLFNPSILPPSTTAGDIRSARTNMSRMFHPDVPSREGLSRRNLPKLLPDANGPKLEGYHSEGPYVTVVGHDWETFALQTEKGMMKVPQLLTMTYVNPVWQKYNEGLTKITDQGKAIGPLIAVGSGHFVQVDQPGFVADELVSLLDRVVNQVKHVYVTDAIDA